MPVGPYGNTHTWVTASGSSVLDLSDFGDEEEGGVRTPTRGSGLRLAGAEEQSAALRLM